MLRKRQFTGWILIFLLVYVVSLPQIRSVYELPDNILLFGGERSFLQVGYPFTASADRQGSLSYHETYAPARPVSFFAEEAAEPCVHTKITFKLFGVLPVRQVAVEVVPPLKLRAGGDSIGIILQGDGVTVVGSSPIKRAGGETLDPAGEAGLRTGDVIVAVNEEKAVSDLVVADRIDAAGRCGERIRLTVKRGDETVEMTLAPAYCESSQRYRIGVFLRDKTMGMGTLTFVDTASGKYGALGHQIAPMAGRTDGQSWHGRIVGARVTGIEAGRAGRPGEKIGVFQADKDILGTIEKNTAFGIYGYTEASRLLAGESLAAASRSQVEKGAAELWTVIDNDKIEKFAVEIEKINPQSNPEGKGFVVKVTDERLLAKTGGIVQGMSGSPIVQNGRLIGALTHVFINDMTKGYGCFLEWMLEENHILPKSREKYLPFLFT